MYKMICINTVNMSRALCVSFLPHSLKKKKKKKEVDRAVTSYKLVLPVKESFLCIAKEKQLLLKTQTSVYILLEDPLT